MSTVYARLGRCPSCRQRTEDDPNKEDVVALSGSTSYSHEFSCPAGHVEVRRFCSCGAIYEYSEHWP